MSFLGEVRFQGKTFMVTEEPEFTEVKLPSPFVNYGDVQVGERYQFEMKGVGKDEAGREVAIYWIFTDTKMQELPLALFYYVNEVSRVEYL